MCGFNSFLLRLPVLKKAKTILFGGSFDPIHNGHLRVARDVFCQLNAGQLIFVPVRRSPHKTDSPVDGKHRVQMIRQATQNDPSFSVSECELNRPAPSYTLDTINFFREQLGEGTDLHWLIGADQLNDFDKWYKVSELLDACRVTVMYRAGYPKPEFNRFMGVLRADQVEKLARDVVQTPLIDISSTQIRLELANGQFPSDLLPQAVIEYIRLHNLYGFTG